MGALFHLIVLKFQAAKGIFPWRKQEFKPMSQIWQEYAWNLALFTHFLIIHIRRAFQAALNQ